MIAYTIDLRLNGISSIKQKRNREKKKKKKTYKHFTFNKGMVNNRMHQLN